MKLYSLSVLHKGSTKSNLLKAAYDLSSFSFFQRSRCVCEIKGLNVIIKIKYTLLLLTQEIKVKIIRPAAVPIKIYIATIKYTK